MFRQLVNIFPIESNGLEGVGFYNSSTNPVHHDFLVSKALRTIPDHGFHGSFHASKRIRRIVESVAQAGNKDNLAFGFF